MIIRGTRVIESLMRQEIIRVLRDQRGQFIYRTPVTPPDPPVGYTPTLWVNSATGDDNRTYATVRGSGGTLPWATIGRAAWGNANRLTPNAAQAAQTGDVVQVSAGTYATTGTANRFTPAYNPVNTGSAGSPLVFVASGTVVLTQTGTGPLIGSLGKSYVIWDGFTINEAQAAPEPDTGSTVMIQSNFCEVRGLSITGIAVTYSDNHCGVRIEQSNNCRVYNCLIHDIADRDTGNPSYGQNSAGVMLYDCNDTIIEHNEIYLCGDGIFVKGQHPGFTQRRTISRYNLIYNCAFMGINLLADYQGKHYQNIIRDCTGLTGTSGFKMYMLGSGEGAEPVGSYIVNNTIIRCTNGAIQIPGGNTAQQNFFYNNIFASQVTAGLVSFTQPIAGLAYTFDRNVYNGSPQACQFNQDGSNQNLSLAAWQAAFAQDANSISSNPLFVNAAANDFHLQGGSPASNLGRTVTPVHGSSGVVIPAGAYITGTEVIGRV